MSKLFFSSETILFLFWLWLSQSEFKDERVEAIALILLVVVAASHAVVGICNTWQSRLVRIAAIPLALLGVGGFLWALWPSKPPEPSAPSAETVAALENLLKVSSVQATTSLVNSVSEPTLKEALTEQTIESNLRLWEMYAMEDWPLSGATEKAMALSGTTLRARYVEGMRYKLTPLIENDNEGIALDQPSLTIRFPFDINVNPPMPKFWAATVNDRLRDFRSDLPNAVLRGTLRGPNETLFFVVPTAGSYPMQYIIEGKAAQFVVRVNGTFTLDLQ